ncbi:MAG: GNAT family N-acetyltransferase, partial [Aeromonadaceae bacterium]|nr:GNAT family N-acetyltransferase [Aeromonadaceae bacterium]
MIRDAQLEDLPALLALEQTAFPGDRLSSRQFRRFIKSDNSRTLVLQQDGQLAGYALVLFHHRTHLARLYSLAIAPPLRGQGLAGQLMEACEQEALARGYLTLRLEVREDNRWRPGPVPQARLPPHPPAGPLLRRCRRRHPAGEAPAAGQTHQPAAGALLRSDPALHLRPRQPADGPQRPHPGLCAQPARGGA